MTEPAAQSLTAAEQQELATSWSEAVVVIRDRQPQQLLGGLNFRINVAKAFKAAWTTAKIYFTAHKIALTGSINPAEIMGIATDVYSLIVTTLDALCERMHPLEYTACVVLSSSPEGMTEQEFEQRLTEFLVTGEGTELPWYVGLTHSRLQASRESLDEEGFTALMGLLRKNDWLLEEGGKVKFKPRHYTWGVSIS